MNLFEKVIKCIINESRVSVDDVESAIDNHNRVIINYHSNGEDKNTGARVIEVYAYGLTKAGNPCIRAWQPYGDTTTRVPSWKFFRLDRITEWTPTNQTFDHPADFYYKGFGDFNPNGDETMMVVYKIAKFGEEEQIPKTPSAQPKTKEDVYKTDTELGMERLRQQLDNPITLSDIKTGDAFKQVQQKTEPTEGPKTKEDVYKTDTERGMERLRQQLENPKKIDLDQFNKKPSKTPEEKQKELDKLRKTLSDKPISLADLNKKMQEPDESELYKTDTERGMERLRQQLENPKKIDLNNIPKR
jgi:hypothetical protein